MGRSGQVHGGGGQDEAHPAGTLAGQGQSKQDALGDLKAADEVHDYTKYDVEVVYKEGQEQVKMTTTGWSTYTVIARKDTDIFKYIGGEALKEALGAKLFDELAKQRKGEGPPRPAATQSDGRAGPKAGAITVIWWNMNEETRTRRLGHEEKLEAEESRAVPGAHPPGGILRLYHGRVHHAYGGDGTRGDPRGA